MISTKKKNKAWVRVWVYLVIREGLSDMWADPVICVPGSGNSRCKTLRWERLSIFGKCEEVRVAGVKWARGRGRDLALEPDHVGSYRPRLGLQISCWMSLKALSGFWIEIWNAQINDLTGSLLFSCREWSMMATSFIPKFFHFQPCQKMQAPPLSSHCRAFVCIFLPVFG